MTAARSEPHAARLSGEAPASGAFVIDLTGLPLSTDLQRLIASEKEEFEAVLGREVIFRAASDAESAWVIEAPTEADSAPALQWRSTSRLASIAASESDFLATMNALHTLCRTSRDSLVVAPAGSIEEAIHVIQDEIAHTYPYFALRGLDWDSISRKHLKAETTPTNFPDMAAAWVAELRGIRPDSA